MLKVLQYNIYFGEHEGINIDDRLLNICSIISSLDADVICLQEVIRDKFTLMMENLEHMYPYAYPNKLHEIDFSYGTVIFSKHVIKNVDKRDYKFTKMKRDIKLVKIQYNENDNIYISTCHFESEFNNSITNKVYQYNTCSNMLQHLHNVTKIPVIMCADTNICKLSEYYFDIAFSHMKGWKDAWIEMNMPINCEYTFNSETNPILVKRYKKKYELQKYNSIYKTRLDRILHLSDLHCVNMQLIGTDDANFITSDHYGLLCTFSKNKPLEKDEYFAKCVIACNKYKYKNKYNTIIQKNQKKLF